MSHGNDRNIHRSPYPGLRPFRRDEADIFYGREEHVDTLLSMLAHRHFVATVGSSGCGKSSLIRAGLIPLLESGVMAEAGDQWRVAQMRPGNDPFEGLADAFFEGLALDEDWDRDQRTKAYIGATLRRGRLGVVELLRQSHSMKNRNLLVLVDQFEEIFRYRRDTDVDAAEAFVKLLLTSTQQTDLSIYVVITMRSDFLGHCAVFSGLPEAMNQGQFLTPRLSRDQCRAAIVGPAEDFDGAVDPALVNRILNEMGTTDTDERRVNDQLPLMQHALMRMWTRARARAARQNGNGNGMHTVTLQMEDYEAIGGMQKTLSRHADEAFEELGDAERKRIAKVLFCRLVEGVGEHATRDPVRLARIADVAEVSTGQVAEVADVFRRSDRSFLTPAPEVQLKSETILDISHESLIRQWDRLGEWLKGESDSAELYRRLLQTGKLWKSGTANLWRSAELQRAEQWRTQHKPNATWADRYGGQLDLSLQFLDASVKAQRGELRARRRQRRWRILLSLGVVGLVLIIGIAAVALYFIQQARDRAERSAYNAQLVVVKDTWRDNPARALELLESAGRPDSEELTWRASQLFERSGRRNSLREFTWRAFHSLATNDPPSLSAHVGAVNIVAFPSDGSSSLLASGGDDGTLRLWNLAGPDNRGPATVFKRLPRDDDILCLAFSASGKQLAYSGTGGTISVCDVGSSRVRFSFEGHAPYSTESLAFSPDGASVASGGDDKSIKIWSLNGSREPRTLSEHSHWVTCVAYSPDGKTLATGSYDTTVKLWNTETWQSSTLTGHTDKVHCLAFSVDGGTLASGDEDQTVRLWDVAEGLEQRRPLAGRNGPVYSVAFSRDGTTLATGNGDGTIKLWDVATWQERITLRRHSGAVYSIAFSADRKTLASASSDGTVKLWDARVGLRMDWSPLERHVVGASFVAFTSSDDRLTSLAKDGSVRKWSFLNPEHEQSNPDKASAGDAKGTESPRHGEITAAAANSKSDSIAAARQDGSIWLWDLGQPSRESRSTWFASPGGRIHALAFDSEGRLLASAGEVDREATESAADAHEEGWFTIWDVATGTPRAMKGHVNGVTSLAFTVGGRFLISGHDDQRVRLWNPTTGCELTEVAGHEDWVTFVAVSRDGETVASADAKGVIRLWKLDGHDLKPKTADVLRGHSDAGVTFLAFSPDGETLASAGMDATIQLWDPQLGQFRAALEGHTGAVRCLSFCSDGTMLASSGDDNKVRIWLAPHVDAASSADGR